VAARRKADQLIAAGQVTVNGLPASPGQDVQAGVDEVVVGGQPVLPLAGWTYLLLNKPRGVLTSVGDARGRVSVVDRGPGILPSQLSGWAARSRQSGTHPVDR